MNLELWNEVCATPKERVKTYEADDGTELKTTQPIDRIKIATEQFGIYGKCWGIKDFRHGSMMVGNMTLATLTATFYVTDKTEYEVSSSIAVSIIEDGKMTIKAGYLKSLETDVLMRGLRLLGFNADIYTDEELVKSKQEEEDEVLKVDFIELGGEEND